MAAAQLTSRPTVPVARLALSAARFALISPYQASCDMLICGCGPNLSLTYLAEEAKLATGTVGLSLSEVKQYLKNLVLLRIAQEWSPKHWINR